MKILWSSNAPHCTSGYGIQTRHVVAGLEQMGHEVALAPNFGLQGAIIEAGNMRVYPSYRDKVGQDVLAAHAKHFGADLVVTLYDLWPYDAEFAARLARPWAAWFPQDSYPPCSTVVERARTVDYPIAMSRFGVESMANQGVDCHYIPHGVDVQTYKPMDKAAMRKELNVSDKFTVMMVAMNQSWPSRKAFPEALLAFKTFHAQYPDTQLYLHTTRKPRSLAWDGIELDVLVQSLGLQDSVIFAEEYGLVLGLPEGEMAKLYNCADVLLSPSLGEGFGVPIIEAQACGIPVITNKFSAMPEVTFNGYCLEPLQMQWTAINTWMATPSVERVTQGLIDLYERPYDQQVMEGRRGRDAMIERYAWPVIMDHWREFLGHVEHGTKPATERLYHCAINGVEFDCYDDKLSFTVPCVEGELRGDRYKFEGVEFGEGDIILDIGAHVGVFAIYAAKKWPVARIVAYEPSPTNFARLFSNVAATGLTNIELHNTAVTADGRDIELALSRGNTGGTSALRKPNGHLVEKAASTTLDAIVGGLGGPFVGSYPRVRFLKIDAEGMEHEILTTATCLNQVDYLAGEFHINSRLEAAGYSIAGLFQHCKQYLDHVSYTSCRMDE